MLHLLSMIWWVAAKASGGLRESEEFCVSDGPTFVPKTLHHIWFNFGRGGIPSLYVNLAEKLQTLNPGWEHRTWNEPQVERLIQENLPWFLATWKNYDVPIKRHDSARAVILFVYGGVYLDHDFIPVKGIEPLIGGCKFVVGNHEESPLVHPANGFIASYPRNPFFLWFLHDMLSVADDWVVNATGPMLLASSLEAFMRAVKPNRYKIYHRKYLYPSHWSKHRKLSHDEIVKEYPDCFLFQLYAASWDDKVEAPGAYL